MTLVLVVEDKEQKRHDRVRLLEELECNVVATGHPDDAIRVLRASPNFDLVIADINFSVAHDEPEEADLDSSGIDFGEWLAAERYPTTIAGYSGHFGEETPVSRRAERVFRNYATKGKIDSGELYDLFRRWIAEAEQNKRHRLESARLRILEIESAQPDIVALYLEKIRRLRLEIAAEQDAALVAEGYELQIVQPVTGDFYYSVGRSFLVWVRERNDGVDVEVYQVPALYCTGADIKGALDALSDLIVSYYLELRQSENVTGPAMELKDWLLDIFSRFVSETESH